MSDFSAMIANFATPGVSRRRFTSPGTLDTTTGYFADMSYADTTIVASVQRPSGKQLQLLPEGQRADESLIAYTAADVRTADVPNQLQADQLLYNGFAYEVQSVSDRLPSGNFLRLVCKKAGQ